MSACFTLSSWPLNLTKHDPLCGLVVSLGGTKVAALLGTAGGGRPCCGWREPRGAIRRRTPAARRRSLSKQRAARRRHPPVCKYAGERRALGKAAMVAQRCAVASWASGGDQSARRPVAGDVTVSGAVKGRLGPRRLPSAAAGPPQVAWGRPRPQSSRGRPCLLPDPVTGSQPPSVPSSPLGGVWERAAGHHMSPGPPHCRCQGLQFAGRE